MSSPTQRSLAEMRKRGFLCEVVERWNQWSKRRQDLFGCIDIVCVCGSQKGVTGVQTTSYGNMSTRVSKIAHSANMKVWLDAGNTILVHGWRKKNGRWVLREKEMYATDILDEPKDKPLPSM